eukprot:s799_g8.t1
MWHPPELGYDGLAINTRLPRQSTPPSRSTRSKLPERSEASSAEFMEAGIAPSLDLAKLASRTRKQVSRPAHGSPCSGRRPDEGREGLSASQCLAEELRPSTPPKQPRRSKLRRASFASEKLHQAGAKERLGPGHIARFANGPTGRERAKKTLASLHSLA